MSGTPLTSGRARVFIIAGQARADHVPSYEYSMRITAPTQGFGDVTKIEEPDPARYDSWREAGEIRGANERATTTLEGHYAQEILSTMLSLARKRCAFDIQLHLGACQDPRTFNTFDKVLIFEKAYATSWGTGDLGALQSEDNATVDETLEISSRDMYEVVPVTFGRKADTLVTNEVYDIAISDYPACGDCGKESDGCYKIFAITKSAGGSAGTPPDIVFSIDKGVNWYVHDIDSLATTKNPDGVDVVGLYVVVVSNDGGGLNYALLTEFNSYTDPTFTLVATGFVALKMPNAIWSFGNGAYIVGDGGYIYSITSDPTAGATVLDAGALTTSKLNDIHGLSEDFAVAVGGNGVVLYTTNGTLWTKATSPVSYAVTLNCVFVKSKTEWWVGSSTGKMFYTLDSGVTWTEKTFSGSGAGTVHDIEFSTPTVGYMAHSTATPAGRILRTIDGGQSWYIMPQGSTTIPANDKISNIAVCSLDPNFIVGGGLADDGSDGIIVLGAPSA